VQAKVWCFVLVPNKPSKGLVYLTTKGLVMVRWVGAVRVYLTSKLWLGAWLGAKRKDKVQG
jgi:hypothetical protein